MNKMTGSVPIDLAFALERTGGEMDFLEELIDMYMEDFEEKHKALREAVHIGDVVQVRELSHSLKGSSANLGLFALKETFYKLEIAGRDRDLIDADKNLDLLQKQFQELKTFWDNRDQTAQDQTGIESPRINRNDSSEAKILLADDSEDSQRLMEKFLSQVGRGLDLANDGHEALTLFLKNSYAIIFLDLNMPKLDGIETVRQIRKIEKENDLSPTPIICLSASSFQDEIDKCLASGFDDYIEKPFDRETLLKAIDTITKKNFSQKNSEKIQIDESILELVPSYLKNRISDLRKMKEALEEEAFSTIEAIAHKMKGSGTSYGFEKISLLGKQIETFAKENDLTKIRHKVEELENFLENIQHE